ncbi:bola-like protein [Teratosphaeria destructans]|uniref:Bola-like protein n=1 Tax=Teratosphaeria destructans TaxID=418781 RepID=A0A9W7SSL2_9PEZI|nr:bola-like protein [Teratosphaeria destructans]
MSFPRALRAFTSPLAQPPRLRLPLAQPHRLPPHQRRPHATTDSPSVDSPPAHLDDRERHIFHTLTRSLHPTKLEVQDVSGGCGSMYALDIVSERFRGLSVIQQHRLVNRVLGEEIKGWHGLQLKTKAP